MAFCFDDERAVECHRGLERCWSRIGSALATSRNGLWFAAFSETDVVLLDASLQPVSTLQGLRDVRCCALGASHLLVVQGSQWTLSRIDEAGRALTTLHRDALLYAAADTDLLERSNRTLVMAFAGPCGVSLLVAQGAAAPRTVETRFRRSSVVCVKLSTTHLGIACADGHIAVLTLDRALNASSVVHEDKFCAFMPSDQRPTQLVIAHQDQFACVSWEGSVLIVGCGGDGTNGGTWAALRYIPALFLHGDGGRLSPPSFVIPVQQPDGTWQWLVAHGHYVDTTRVPASSDTVIGAVAWTQSRFLIIDRAYRLMVGIASRTQPTDWVCPQLSAAEAVRLMESVLPAGGCGLGVASCILS
jgi:hypothetical protein